MFLTSIGINCKTELYGTILIDSYDANRNHYGAAMIRP